MRLGRWITWIYIVAITFSTMTAFADDLPSRSVEESRAESFQTVKGPVAEEVPGGMLLGAAYTIVWLLLMLYVFRIERQSARIEKQLAQIEQSLSTGKHLLKGSHHTG